MSYCFYITPEQYAIAEKNGIHAKLVTERVRRLAWGIERAITTPPRKFRDLSKWVEVAKQNGISPVTYYGRVRQGGMDPEKAAITPIMSTEEIVQKMITGQKAFKGGG